MVVPGEAVVGTDGWSHHGTTCSPCTLPGGATGACSPGEDGLLLLERSPPCSTLCQSRPWESRRCGQPPQALTWAWRWPSP